MFCADVESNDEEICHQAGGPCEVVKRAANAAAEAMAVADPGWKDPAHHQCYGRGGMCFKAKRALDGLSGVVDSML